MNTEQIAKVAHDVNKSYCEAIGDMSQPCWDDAPDWQRDSARNGVKFHIDHPDMTPEQSHINWVKDKVAAGWKQGPVKDPIKKEHPCIEHYSLLPTEQKVKDFLFRQVVHSLKDL